MPGIPEDPDPTDDSMWGLPGEDRPLPMRYGGEPVSPHEALGVARRLQRVARGQARLRGTPDEKLQPMPVAVPLPEAPSTIAAYRFPPRLLMLVRAKAEMEGRTATSVLTEAMEGYVNSSPGARPVWRTPKVQD